MSSFVEYGNEKVDHTLDPDFMTPFLKNAQTVEFKELIKLISALKGRGLKIFDIGVGNGRIPLKLSKSDVWGKISLFVGIENSPVEIIEATDAIRKARLDNKVKIVNFDALNLVGSKNRVLEQKYDLIICTYFTPGNFKPDEIKIKTDGNGKIVPYPKESLNPNKNFIKVFKSAYMTLNPDGKIFLGSIYIDTDENRKRQEEFYEKCGMTVITSKDDEFTATKEGFWSERFTKEKIHKYFCWVNKENIEFIPLDNYDFAQSVIVSKP